MYFSSFHFAVYFPINNREVLANIWNLYTACIAVVLPTEAHALIKNKIKFSSYALIKKENQIFLIYRESQSGAVAKSYMRKGFLIYEEMRKYFHINEEAVSYICLRNCSTMNFPKYEENSIFFFISAISYCGVGEWRICARLPHLGTGGAREHERRQPAERVGQARRWWDPWKPLTRLADGELLFKLLMIHDFIKVTSYGTAYWSCHFVTELAAQRLRLA